MTASFSQTTRMLVITVGAHACALPLLHVAETMRPLPIEPVAGTPTFVRGVAVIRGRPTPVVDLGALLEKRPNRAVFGRFVTVKLGERRVAIGVDSIVGLRDLETAQLGEMPPILGDLAGDLIESIGVLDAQLLTVLRVVLLVPGEVWVTLAAAEASL